MKKLIILIGFLFCFLISFSQSIHVRSNNSITNVDSSLFVATSFRIPTFADTTAANSAKSLDSCGKIIFTYDANSFWVRECNPKRWVSGAQTNIFTPTCGLQNETGIVSYDDSTLNFDISPAIYALCCDNIPRTSAFTHKTLDSNDASDPRIDAIVLDSTGVVVLKGTPDANPASPELSSCQILLINVLINAGENIPANITVDPVIYDEGTEWDTTSTGATVNFRDMTAPAHLTHDIKVNPYTIATTNTITLTNSSTIQITDYSVLKLYIQLRGAIPIGNSTFMTLRWGNGGQWQSEYLAITKKTYGFNPSSVAYQVLTIPISDFKLYSGTVDKLQIILRGNNAYGVYIDWIQLQSGLNQGGGTNSGTVTQFSSGNLSPLFTTSVTFPTTTPALSFTQSNATAQSALVNRSNVAGAYSWGKVSLTNMVDGLLPFTNLAVIPANYYLGSLDGITNQALPVSSLYDSAFAKNWQRVIYGTKDTLVFGSPDPDSALLSYETYVGLNGYAFHIQSLSSLDDMFFLNPQSNATLETEKVNGEYSELVLTTNGAAGQTSFNLYAVDSASNQVFVLANAIDSSVVIGGQDPFVRIGHTLNPYMRLQIESGRFGLSKGASVAAANDLTLGQDGNVFHITGNTQINAITTYRWQDGSEVILIFDSNPTVKNNTAGGAGTATLLLSGGVDFSATANDVLRLVYDGTNWIEEGRSVN